MTVVHLPAPAPPRDVARLPSFVERHARDRADAALNRAAHGFADLMILRAATFDNTADRASRERDALAGILTELGDAHRALTALAEAA
jgi:hypothetical protein